MSERSRISTYSSVRANDYGAKKSRSQSESSTSRERMKFSTRKSSIGSSPVGTLRKGSLGVIETSPSSRTSLSSCPHGSCTDVLSTAVEEAVSRAIHGSLQDLHKDVGKIHIKLSEIAEKISDRKRIAIIGAGPCGIASAKSCLEEGLDVVVFEKSGSMGGLWCYREDDIEGFPSVMKSTVINTSKEMSAFSDFPPPKDFPNFMHNSTMLQYFQIYAEKFGLLQYVRFLHEVVRVAPTEDYERTGRWYVTFRKVKESESYREAFDGVLVATGHHCYPYIPDISGLREFKGKVLHTHSLKKAAGFEDKNVLVVGIGNSAVDAAVELSSVTKKLYLSTRRGTWLFQRVGPGGKPYDASYNTRILSLLFRMVPMRTSSWFLEREVNKRFDHAAYGLKPKHRIFNAHPTMNDALPNKLLSGTIILREDIKEFTENGVIFQTDDHATEIDAVIFATGYQMRFPFLEDSVLPIVNNKVQLYKYVFPPHLSHPSLAIIALVQVWGCIFPAAEAQSRWYALVMTGKKCLPRKDAMMADIKSKERKNSKRYVASPRHTVQVDTVTYMDELAKQIGAKPKILKLFFTDPKLFYHCFFGPSLPYQYRLRGPHSWPGAREAILGYESRVLSALQTRKSIKD